MGHTPTPWEAQDIEDEGPDRGFVFIIGSNLGGLVGSAMPWGTELDSGDFSRVQANAAFIVRAVNQHASLLQCAEALRALMKVLDHEDPWDVAHLNEYNAAVFAADSALSSLEQSNG